MVCRSGEQQVVHARGGRSCGDRCAGLAQIEVSRRERGPEEGIGSCAKVTHLEQMNAPAAPAPSRWSGVISAPNWLRKYDRSWFRADLAAGVTLAAYLLPAALGDASLAGLPPEAGLYACLFGGLVFWIFCSSRHTSITVTSAISLLIGSSLGAMADGDPSRYAALAACTALLTATIAFFAWLARAGSAVNFISDSVMLGFKAGVALHLASTQLPKLFGVHGGHGDFWERIGVFLKHVGETNFTSLLL